jgi:hypothetical protein
MTYPYLIESASPAAWPEPPALCRSTGRFVTNSTFIASARRPFSLPSNRLQLETDRFGGGCGSPAGPDSNIVWTPKYVVNPASPARP